MTAGRDRQRLVETHQSYAHAIAAEVLRKLPPQVERQELESAAELGLVEAANAFDPSRGVQFKTFAYYRIRGAIYDALRKMGWFSKSMYDEMKFAAAANDYMTDHTEASAPAGDPAQQWRELQNITSVVVNCYMLSLDSMTREWADGSVPADEQLERKQQAGHLRQALSRLPEKNRQVMEAYYFQDLNLEQIGARLGLSKSWVSRVHARSLDMLRGLIGELAAAPGGGAHATFDAGHR